METIWKKGTLGKIMITTGYLSSESPSNLSKRKNMMLRVNNLPTGTSRWEVLPGSPKPDSFASYTSDAVTIVRDLCALQTPLRPPSILILSPNTSKKRGLRLWTPLLLCFDMLLRTIEAMNTLRGRT